MSKYIHITGLSLGAPSYVRGWRPGYVCYVIEPGKGTGNTTHPAQCVIVRGVIVGTDPEDPEESDLYEVRVGKRSPGWYEASELHTSESAAFKALARRCDEISESYREHAQGLRQRALTG